MLNHNKKPAVQIGIKKGEMKLDHEEKIEVEEKIEEGIEKGDVN